MAEFTGQTSNIRFILGEGRRGLALGGLVTLGLAGFVGHIWARGQDSHFAITPGQMPACDSPVSRRGLRDTITDAPAAKLVGLTVLRINTVGELASEPASAPDRRICIATVFTNAGRKLIGFTLSWASEAKDDVYLELPYGID
ncbi:hypothetical protein [Methylobacterium sp. J-077]|uniref:hypothetical protein n=1 Tax=Methylobacterium sp. J-077 TaxID=2836656 RepID=UPI001FB8D43D|nr:hypothetical protein [Methylobacterium sp. J-077]MCJ2126972.1 hypothetical protein [Methylobacterium sp. J-077]